MPAFGQRSADHPIFRARDQFRANNPEYVTQTQAQVVAAPLNSVAAQSQTATMESETPVQNQPQVQAVEQVKPQPQPQLRDVDSMSAPDGYADLLNNPAVRTAQTLPQQDREQLENEIKQLRAERDQMTGELSQLRKNQEYAQQLSKELTALKEKQDVDRYINDLGNLGSVNPDDARKIVTPLIQVMQKDRDAITRTLTAQRAELDERFKSLHQYEHNRRQQDVLEKIYKAHPDLKSLQNTRAYADYMMQPVGGNSGLLTGQLVAAELKNGNADYVIGVLNQIKQAAGGQRGARLSDVASVSANSTGGASAAVSSGGGRLSYEQLAELNNKFIRRQISRADYQAALAKHRAAISP